MKLYHKLPIGSFIIPIDIFKIENCFESKLLDAANYKRIDELLSEKEAEKISNNELKL